MKCTASANIIINISQYQINYAATFSWGADVQYNSTSKILNIFLFFKCRLQGDAISDGAT